MSDLLFDTGEFVSDEFRSSESGSSISRAPGRGLLFWFSRSLGLTSLLGSPYYFTFFTNKIAKLRRQNRTSN